MFGWSDRPTKAEVKYLIGGDNPARVITVGWGEYEITIPDDVEADVTYRRQRGGSDPRQTFPNMEVRDGELKIPLEDITDSILARVQPDEIAAALWQNEAVRERFVKAMITRYSCDSVTDSDRRKVLDGLKETIHSAALDSLVSAMASLDYANAKHFYLHSQIRAINDTLEHYGVTRPARGDEDGPQPLRIKDEGQTALFRIGGEAWTEARDFWRREMLRQFPVPASVDRSGEADETSTKIEGSAEGESAVPATPGDAPQTPPSESPL